jgi:hypothetical protein
VTLLATDICDFKMEDLGPRNRIFQGQATDNFQGCYLFIYLFIYLKQETTNGGFMHSAAHSYERTAEFYCCNELQFYIH